MAITRATLIAFSQTLSNGRASTVTLGDYYDLILSRMAMQETAPMVSSTDLAISSGTARYAFPADAVKLLGIFDRGRQLMYIEDLEIESYEKTWRDDTGEPIAYYTMEDAAESVLLYPSPSTTSTGQWLHTIASTSIPDYLAFFVMSAMLELEFAYPSDHQDKEVSYAWGALRGLFGEIAGVSI